MGWSGVVLVTRVSVFSSTSSACLFLLQRYKLTCDSASKNADFAPIVGISPEDLQLWGDGMFTDGFSEKGGGLQNPTLDFNHTAAQTNAEIPECATFYSPVPLELGYKLPHFPDALRLDVAAFQYNPVMYTPVQAPHLHDLNCYRHHQTPHEPESMELCTSVSETYL
jgi:hypothetical protein